MQSALQSRSERIESLVELVKTAPDEGFRSAAVELVQTLLEFHREGLDRLMEIVAGADPEWAVIEALGRDELVSHMLLLHGMHPFDVDVRVREALDRVRPYLHSHGGDVELLSVTDGTVRLRLVGACHSCPSSTMTLKSAIEKAVYELAPEVTAIECDRPEELVTIAKE